MGRKPDISQPGGNALGYGMMHNTSPCALQGQHIFRHHPFALNGVVKMNILPFQGAG
jgi:hypothetical protein